MLARPPWLLALLFISSPAVSQAPALVTVPALTPVVVRIGEEISSKTNKPGDQFPITVAEDVRVGDEVVIPVGSAGIGEVIHAAKPGAGGKAGELILAARFVELGDTRIRLRSFALGVAGKNNSEAALATSFIAGPFAMFVRGGAVVVPRDTLGIAKTALEFKLPAVVAPAPQPQSVETKVGGDDESKTD